MTSSDVDATQSGLDDLHDVLETSFCAQYPDEPHKADSISSYGLTDLDNDFSDEDIKEEPAEVEEVQKVQTHAPSVETHDLAGDVLKTQDRADIDTSMDMKGERSSHTPSVRSIDPAGAGLPTRRWQQIVTQPAPPDAALSPVVTRPEPDPAKSPAPTGARDSASCRAGGIKQTTLDTEDPLKTFEKPWTPKSKILKAKMEGEYLLPSQARTFWSYELYRDNAGKQPEVHYCQTLSQSEACAKLFLHELIIGFDMEWRPRYQPGIKTNASLIQLASESHIGLFHIAQHPGKTPRELMAPSLRKVLESPRILKTGVAVINADGKRSKKYFKIEPRGLFELSWLHWQIQDKAPKKPVALAKLTQIYLRLPLSKGPVRCSDWSKPLSPAQVRYSASDAYVGFQLFHVMNNMRLALCEVPPLSTPTDLSLVPTFQASTAPASSILRKSQRGRKPSISITQAPKVHGLPTSSHDPSNLYDDEARIHAALVQRHDEILENDRTPKYCRPLEAVLVEIARRKPRSLDQLQQIKGVGKARTSKFGPQWLAVVKQFHDRPPTSQQPLNARSKRVFSALCGLRIQLARKSGIDPLMLASDSVLRAMALVPPRVEADVHKIDGCKELTDQAAYHGVSLLAFITKHDDRNPTDSAPRSPLKSFTTPQVNVLNGQSGSFSPRAFERERRCEEISEPEDEERFASSTGLFLKRRAPAKTMQSPPRRQKLLPNF